MKTTQLSAAHYMSLSAALLLSVTAVVALADRSLRLSALSLSATNGNVTVYHRHDFSSSSSRADARKAPGIVAKPESTLRIVRNDDSHEISRTNVMPLTAIQNIENSPYFVGLSDLKALAFEYNFLMIDETGAVLSRALVTYDSGHCKNVGGTVTNYINWFDKENPKVRLATQQGGNKVVIVENPYDKSEDGQVGTCVFHMAIE